MKDFKLTATNLRLMLSIGLFVIAALYTVAFSFVSNELKKVAVDVSHKTVDANASQNNLQIAQKIEKDLEEKSEVVERAQSIVADSQSYQYQNQIITDLNDYANRAGITITNIDFSAATPQGAAAATPAAPLTTPVPSGVNSSSVSATLKNPVDYNSLLRFIYSIEQNLTKMQISKVGLSKDSASDGVTSDVFTIEVYIR